MRGDVNKLQAESAVTAKLVVDVAEMGVKLDNINTSALKHASIDIDTLEQEIQDRVCKMNNILLYKVPEPNPGQNYVTADAELVTGILSKIKSISFHISSVKRVGRPNADVFRPLVITLRSRHDVFRVLSAQDKLSYGVKAATDKTEKQRETLRNLHKLVKENNAASDVEYKVKYVKNIPKLVPVGADNGSRPKNH